MGIPHGNHGCLRRTSRPATITGRLKRTASIVVAPLTRTAAESRSSSGTGAAETRSAYLAAGGVGPPKTR